MDRSKIIKIGTRIVGGEHPCFIIAEAGVNHNGSIKLAKKMIDVAADAKVDAIKFQTFKTEDLVTKAADTATYQQKNTGKKESQYNMLKKLELKHRDFKELKRYCDKKKILFLSTPHTEEAFIFLETLIPAYKIASGDLTNLPFLEIIAKKAKPIILSTGMGTLEEIKEAVDYIKKHNKKIILLHCTTEYPCPKKEVNLKAMKTLEKETGCLVGYSDHTKGIEVPIMAAQLGAVIIEKHFTLDKRMKGPDHKASLEPNELKKMIEKIRAKKKVQIPKSILGNGIKKPTRRELKIAKIVRKSIVAKKNIAPNQIIKKDMLIIKRPGTGIPPKNLRRIIGKKAALNIKKDEIIKWQKIK